MGELAELGALFVRLSAARVRAQIQYRVSFALQVLAHFLGSFLDLVAILVIFANVPALGGWTVAEVTLLSGISNLSFALTDLVVGHLDDLPRVIREGAFDLVLIRPRGTLFQIVTGDFQLRRVGKVAQGAVVLAYALSVLPIDWTPARIVVLAATVPAAVVIFASIWIAAICISFWSPGANEAANAFTYGGNFLTQYPINIYDRWIRRFLAYVVPTAFVAYFPALYLLGKPDPLGLPAWLGVISPLVALASAVVAAAVWRFAVRHYQSAGG